MPTHLSPRDLSCVIGVSESSLKRWADDGRLVAQRTAGGHRRITMADAVRFLRRSAVELCKPEMMGLGDLTAEVLERVRAGGGDAALYSAIRKGDGAAVRGVVLAEFMLSRTLGPVCDGPIAFAMNRLHEELVASGDGRLIDERASRTLIEAIELVQGLLGPAAAGAPGAAVIGRSGSGGLGASGVGRRLAAAALQESGFEVSGGEGGFDGRGAGCLLVCVVMGKQGTAEGDMGEIEKMASEGARVVLWGGPAVKVSTIGRELGVICVDSVCELQSVARVSLAEHSTGARTTRKLARTA